MLGGVNKLFVFKSLLTMASNVLLLHPKKNFPPIIRIFTEGEGVGLNQVYLLKSFFLNLNLCFDPFPKSFGSVNQSVKSKIFGPT